MGIALEGQNPDDRAADINGIRVVYDERLEGWLENAVLDFRRTLFGKEGFFVDTGFGC
jgi:Fe-S cluster assembly iron-binding protein IscA